jgi:hypothetical protein
MFFIKSIKIPSTLTYLIFLLFILLQGVVLLILFNQSIIIDGDMIQYLSLIKNGPDETVDFEPASLLIFKLIGLFSINFHFFLLFCFILTLSTIESWIVFKKTRGSILWLLFFSLTIMPFFHAINLRTGFGMFFLFLLFENYMSVLVVPLFHASYIPLIAGINVKSSKKNILFGFILIILFTLIFTSLITSKVHTYYSYYSEGDFSISMIIEIFCLFLFSIFLKEKYKLTSKIIWYRIFYIVLIISLISFNFPIFSSRFLTLSYLILLFIRLNSGKNNNKNFAINLFFIIFIFIIIFFRIYRILTMFGFLDGIGF